MCLQTKSESHLKSRNLTMTSLNIIIDQTKKKKWYKFVKKYKKNYSFTGVNITLATSKLLTK